MTLKQNSTEDFSNMIFFAHYIKKMCSVDGREPTERLTSFVFVVGITRVVIREGQ